MADGINPKHLDKRTVDRYQRGGQVDEQAYKQHLENLPDVAEKAETIKTTMGDEFDEDEFDDEEDDTDADDADDDAEDSDDEDKAAE